VTYEREVDRMKTDFLSTAAHELRTPLTSIEGFSELLMSRDDITEIEHTRFLSHINRQSRNLAAIISDLLDISRIESGRGVAMVKVSSDMKKIVKDAASYFESVSAVHRFALDFPAEPVELLIDPEKMEQVLGNIFSNAVKYSPGGGVIKIVGEISGDHYQVSVEDKGIGMTPEQAEKIFDKFYRVDSSNTAVPGTGLGMSIVKHIVEAHGGTVWVESEIGKGTTVRFTIPLKSNNG
ncbi:MAG: HAMP domain-containing histidine kinase, partial [Deltaproteobacteria bacterium]|nr:HAMP domain-containing histidine kinase [Deltaproteobacteria bacterium]